MKHKLEKQHRLFDSELYTLFQKEKSRQINNIQLNAAENISSKNVLFPLISSFSSKTAEGIPGNRYHSGCEIIDKMEIMAEKRLNNLFKSKQSWVQPLSGSMANLVVINSIMEEFLPCPSKARIFSMKLDHGGHLSHSSKYNLTGKIFTNSIFYSVEKNNNLLDYDKIHAEAIEYKPHLIICGASSYPREINFRRFGEIADDCGATLLSDISHIFGLIVAGVHPSPYDHSNFITSSTYKAGGPHGGIIVAGKKATEEQRTKINKYIFPVIQSTPDFGSIASKAAFFKEMTSTKFSNTQKKIKKNAQTLANQLQKKGYNVVTDGTDNHMVLINILTTHKLTGKEASMRLAKCGIYANRNLIPFDSQNATNCSGLRFGTNTVSRIGMKRHEMKILASLIDEILKTDLTKEKIKIVRKQVKNLANKFTLKSKAFF